jgi:hypothetical protein
LASVVASKYSDKYQSNFPTKFVGSESQTNEVIIAMSPFLSPSECSMVPGMPKYRM